LSNPSHRILQWTRMPTIRLLKLSLLKLTQIKIRS